MKYQGIFSALALLAATELAAAPEPKTASPAAGSTTSVYSVTRNGSPIGTMSTNIAKAGDTIAVTTKTAIEVKVIIVLYRLSQSTTETWRGDQLLSFTSETDDNGTAHTITVKASPRDLIINVDGKTVSAPAGTMPTSFWSTRFLTAKALLNNDDGAIIHVVSRNLGAEQINVRGALHQAQHYKVSGGKEFERDIWFDGDQLLRVRLKGSDGSLISSDLQ
jgi:hypothetical protein